MVAGAWLVVTNRGSEEEARLMAWRLSRRENARNQGGRSGRVYPQIFITENPISPLNFNLTTSFKGKIGIKNPKHNRAAIAPAILRFRLRR